MGCLMKPRSGCSRWVQKVARTLQELLTISTPQIVVTQYHDGRAGQVRSEDTLATGVEAVAIRERENWQGRVEVDLNAHGRARCS